MLLLAIKSHLHPGSHHVQVYPVQVWVLQDTACKM